VAHTPAPGLVDRLKESKRRFEFLTEQLTRPEVITNRQEFSKLSRERSELEEIVTTADRYLVALESYTQARALLEDPKSSDLHGLAQIELSELEPWLESQTESIQLLLLPKDPNDEKNVILEIRAGVGGDESSLFAADLFRMYSRFADKQKWRVEILSGADGSAGGYKEIIGLIEGERVYSKLKFESGVHRVQRVPKTEAQGRVHTSTVTVAVLPEAEEVDIDINPNELRIDVFRAGGHGGQSVNTTDSAVRITHLPTLEVVVCQDEKSQLKNKNKALKILRTRLLDRAREEQHQAIAAERRAQVGGGFRNERIRTYNFPQGRVTDHRIGLTRYDIDKILGGEIEDYIRALNHSAQLAALRGEGGLQVRDEREEADE
jgi:peptide chain release factor 1